MLYIGHYTSEPVSPWEQHMSQHRIFIPPLWIRIWHWTNALLIITLAVTGASLHFADPDLTLVGHAVNSVTLSRITSAIGKACERRTSRR